MICSLLDLTHVVSRYMVNPGKGHWKVVQWIFRYLCGPCNVCLHFGRTRDGVIGYVDFDFAGDLDKRRSLLEYVWTFIVIGFYISNYNIYVVLTYCNIPFFTK